LLIILLFFQGFDEDVQSTVEVLLRARHEKMVEPAAGVPADGLLNSGPVAIPVLVCKAEQDFVTLAREVLGFLSHSQDHLFNRMLVSNHLLLDQSRSSSLERVDSLSLGQVPLNLSCFLKGVYLLKEPL